MGATLFYKYGNGMSVLPINVGKTNPVSLEDLDSLEEAGLVTIITDARVSLKDTNQFFMSFDDKIHHYHFGKGIGGIMIAGLILPNCDGELVGVKDLFDSIGNMRGQVKKISIGSAWFTGVLMESDITFSGEPMTNAVFQLSFAMLDHSIQSNIQDNRAC